METWTLLELWLSFRLETKSRALSSKVRSVSSIIIFINIIIHCTQYLSSHWLRGEPTANFGNQHNLQISWLSANRQLNKLLVVNLMHDFLWQYQFRFLATVCLSLFSSKQCIPGNKTIIRFGFSDILNNWGLGKYHHPWPSARLITLTSTLIIPDITKTSSSNNVYHHVDYSHFSCNCFMQFPNYMWCNIHFLFPYFFRESMNFWHFTCLAQRRLC